MYIEELITLFKNKGFKIKEMSIMPNEYDDNLYKAYFIKTRKLSIGVFDYNYPNTSYNGKIVIDYTDLFDKWHKCFYMAMFPDNGDEFKIQLADIKYLSKKINYKASDMFCRLTRSF